MRRIAPRRPRPDERPEVREHRGPVVETDDFVTVPLPLLVDASGTQIADAVAQHRREVAVTDARLARPVSVAQKGVALSDLCQWLRGETGIHLAAGRSVADEKVTLFCRERPLRELMRQLARPFGYTWLRSGKADAYQYELTQDLQSQLVEEELRNRDRNAALLALERQIERYRGYLVLSPDEALARSKTASPEEKALLEQVANTGWGPIQVYFRLSPQDQASLRAGQSLTFSQAPGPGEAMLPEELARGVLECNRRWRLVPTPEGLGLTRDADDPRTVPLTADPDARAKVALWMGQSELGVFTLGGASGAFPINSNRWGTMDGEGRPLATGAAASASPPENAQTNARLRTHPALRGRGAVTPRPAASRVPPASPEPAEATPAAGGETTPPARKVTSADVLEAIHRATGLPVVGDFYTRLYPEDQVSVRDVSLFEALCRAADAMRYRWSLEPGATARSRWTA
jgi:hypothetical protein